MAGKNNGGGIKVASRNPLKSGQCFLLINIMRRGFKNYEDFLGRNPLKSGQCFLPCPKCGSECSRIYKKSQSPQIGSMFLTQMCFILYLLQTVTILVAIPSNRVNVSYLFWEKGGDKMKLWSVAIPSNRVNVSYSTHLFLRIIGNLTPLLREPHYFYAFFFPI